MNSTQVMFVVLGNGTLSPVASECIKSSLDALRQGNLSAVFGYEVCTKVHGLYNDSILI